MQGHRPKKQIQHKGQLISNCLFGMYLQFSQKTNKRKINFTTMVPQVIVFVRFLGELKTPKRHFEINWTLQKRNWCWIQVSAIKVWYILSALWSKYNIGGQIVNRRPKMSTSRFSVQLPALSTRFLCPCHTAKRLSVQQHVK